MPLIKIKEAVIVEGKYDKIKLSSIIDAVIIETSGFSVFRDKEMLDLIRRLAEQRGVLIITDSDSAGFKIRHYISGSLPKDRVKHAYIPEIFGKEHRKAQPSKEGLLGLEGIPAEKIMQSLRKAGVLCENVAEPEKRITKTDLYEDGFTGRDGSHEKRMMLLEKLELPKRLSTNSMLGILNAMINYDKYKEIARSLK